MKSIILAATLYLTSCILHAQAAHSITLNLVDNRNPAGTVYNWYRANVACPTTTPLVIGQAPFSKVGSNVASTTFMDQGMNPGTYCYYATAVTAASPSSESNPSNTAPAPILFFPPVITVTIAQ